MTDALTRAAIEAHREWLGFVQPVGLVVAEPVLVERGVILDRHARPRQERFKELLDGDEQRFSDIRALFTEFSVGRLTISPSRPPSCTSVCPSSASPSSRASPSPTPMVAHSF